MTNHEVRAVLRTVYNRHTGAVEGRGLTVVQAAEIILAHDGSAYSIERGDASHDIGGESQWWLFSKEANGRWGRTSSVKPIYAISAEAAWPLIAREVLRVCGEWRLPLSVVTDADYDAMIADAE